MSNAPRRLEAENQGLRDQATALAEMLHSDAVSPAGERC